MAKKKLDGPVTKERTTAKKGNPASGKGVGDNRHYKPSKLWKGQTRVRRVTVS